MTSSRSKAVKIYTDGSSLGNPGPGGWAFVAIIEDNEINRSGGYKKTTNSRMELMAVEEALKFAVEEKLDSIIIHSDSNYIVKAFNENWIRNWLNRGWKKSNKEKVANVDIWKSIVSLTNKVKVKFQKVPAHSGNKYNEICDELAKNAAMGSDLPDDKEYINKNNGSSDTLFQDEIKNNIELNIVFKGKKEFIEINDNNKKILVPRKDIEEFLNEN